MRYVGGLFIACALLIVQTAFAACPITYIGQSEAYPNAPNTDVVGTLPTGAVAGDVLVAALVNCCGTNYAPTPSGWTLVNEAQSSVLNYNYQTFVMTYSSGTSWSFGSSNLQYPDIIIRAYSGANGTVDASNAQVPGTASTTNTIPAFSAGTAGNGEMYIAFFGENSGSYPSGAVTLTTGDLVDTSSGTAAFNYYPMGNGDKIIATAGTTPPAEGASTVSSQTWFSAALTLKPVTSCSSGTSGVSASGGFFGE